MSNLNDIINQQREEIAQLREQLAKANERVAELEEKNDLMMTRLMAAALGLASGKSCPTAIEELNKFAIEQKRIGYYDSCIKSGLNEGQASLLSDIYACFAKGVSRD